MIRNFAITAALASCLLLTGCAGGGASVQTSSATYGQQLIDLKAAFDKGIISQDEYDDARKAILDKMED